MVIFLNTASMTWINTPLWLDCAVFESSTWVPDR